MSTVARVRLVDLATTHAKLGAELIAAVERVAQRGAFILAAEVEAFEAELATRCGARHAVGVASGTDALVLALRAVGVRRGDGVATSPLSFIATAEAILRAGATPYFVDVDPDTLCLEATRLPANVTAVVPVHLYGRAPATLGAWEVPVIHDAAQAAGARFDLREAACFSFFPTKNLGAWGDGGAIVTSDDELARVARRLRSHGRSAPNAYDGLGYNSRLDEIQAAVLRVKLNHLDWVHQRRRHHAELYRELLPSSVRLPPRLGADDACHLFTVRVGNRDAVRTRLSNEGVETGVYYPKLLFDHAPIAAHATGDLDCPNARQACAEVLSLPVHEHLELADLQRVARALR